LLFLLYLGASSGQRRLVGGLKFHLSLAFLHDGVSESAHKPNVVGVQSEASDAFATHAGWVHSIHTFSPMARNANVNLWPEAISATMR
jgi:hypothetical protein